MKKIKNCKAIEGGKWPLLLISLRISNKVPWAWTQWTETGRFNSYAIFNCSRKLLIWFEKLFESFDLFAWILSIPIKLLLFKIKNQFHQQMILNFVKVNFLNYQNNQLF